jgi:Ca2+-binding RTX toxin-like protein
VVHTFVYEQVGDLPNAANDLLVDLTIPGADPNDFDSAVLGFSNTSGTTVGTTVYGTSGDDTVDETGAAVAQTLYGGAGDDHLTAGNQDDTVYGGSGSDTINGNNGGDTLYGGSGNDIITAGTGKDTIIGGLGADTLTGSQGIDVFVFKNLPDSLATNPPNTMDTIQDFNTGSDQFQIGHVLALAPLQTDLQTVTGGGTGNLAADLAAILDSGNLVANGAVNISITSGADIGRYLVINDANAGYDANHDAVIKLANGATVHVGDFIV